MVRARSGTGPKGWEPEGVGTRRGGGPKGGGLRGGGPNPKKVARRVWGPKSSDQGNFESESVLLELKTCVEAQFFQSLRILTEVEDREQW